MEKRYQKEIAAFGHQLRTLRISRGLSQLDIEVHSGISRTEISRIENGRKNIEFLTMVKLAIALKVDLSEFFQDK